MNRINYLFVFFFLFECSDQREVIIDKWIVYRVDNMISCDSILFSSNDSTYFRFNPDGSYERKSYLGSYGGTWISENKSEINKIVLYEKSDTTILFIEQIEAEKIVWRIEEGESVVKFYLTK